MNIDAIKEYKKFYHNFLIDNVVAFWEKSDLIDKEYGGFICGPIPQFVFYGSPRKSAL